VKTLSLKLPDALHTALAIEAGRAGKTKSLLVREALELYFGHQGAIPSGSCLDLARKYAGCVKGARDLSYARKHMKGYGR
jgi:hypothetical protein